MKIQVKEKVSSSFISLSKNISNSTTMITSLEPEAKIYAVGLIIQGYSVFWRNKIWSSGQQLVMITIMTITENMKVLTWLMEERLDMLAMVLTRCYMVLGCLKWLKIHILSRHGSDKKMALSTLKLQWLRSLCISFLKLFAAGLLIRVKILTPMMKKWTIWGNTIWGEMIFNI